MDIFDKLKKHTEYNNGTSKEAIDLTYEDASFDGVIFTGFDINYGKFLETMFEKCDFSDVYMSGASLCGSTFANCIFSNNIFRKGNADYTSFKKTNLKNVDTFRSSFYEAKFIDLTIEKCQMKSCDLGYASFDNVLFIETDLSDSNFSNVVFKDVKFIDCYFANTTFKNITGLEQLEFENVNILCPDGLKKGLNNEIKNLL